MTRHPLLLALGAAFVVLALAFAMPLWHMWRGQPGPAGADAQAQAQDLPWMVQALPEGRSQVFGLILGQDTMAQVQRRFDDLLQVALVARVDEVGALEALVEPMAAGHVSGRLVLAFEVPAGLLQAWRAQASGSEVMAGGARRFKLRPQDLAQAQAMPLVGISFLPSLKLSENDMLQRFGQPRQRQALDGDALQLVYAGRGLVATVSGSPSGQRSVLQYVTPRELQTRLLAPVRP